MTKSTDKNQDIQIARLEERFSAEREAKERAYTEMQRRLEGMNEFREQLHRQAETFITKADLCASEERTNGEIKLLRAKVDWILWIFILSTLVAIVINVVLK